MGVWIEIFLLMISSCACVRSLPAWECGLKLIIQRKLRLRNFRSLPAWECGLKSDFAIDVAEQVSVTPCVGVWIEMTISPTFVESFMVTPCVGVWIEIRLSRVSMSVASVTPCVGVWIEMAI